MTPVNMKYEEWDVLGDRRSPYGNPFKVGKDGTREEVLAKFHHYYYNRPALRLRAHLRLKGKRVGCWCKPKACHLDIIAADVNRDWSNGMPKEKATCS